jgi:hypothetical protein
MARHIDPTAPPPSQQLETLSISSKQAHHRTKQVGMTKKPALWTGKGMTTG